MIFTLNLKLEAEEEADPVFEKKVKNKIRKNPPKKASKTFLISFCFSAKARL